MVLHNTSNLLHRTRLLNRLLYGMDHVWSFFSFTSGGLSQIQMNAIEKTASITPQTKLPHISMVPQAKPCGELISDGFRSQYTYYHATKGAKINMLFL